MIDPNSRQSRSSLNPSLGHVSIFGPLILAISLAGCGGITEQKEVYSVSGTVFLNGKPAADAWITLAPDAEGVPSPMGRVEKDGSFQLTVYDQDLAKFPKRGDPAGEYHVLIRMPKDPSMPLSPDRLGGAYADPRVFDHVVTIEVGENTLDPIQIDNAKLVN